MNKGLIMELKKDYAIVLNDDGGMEKILIKPGMSVGQKIFYFEEDIVKASAERSFKYNNSFMKSLGSIAALFLLVFTFFYNYSFNKTYAIVSLDINPSIQIEVDNSQKILSVKGMNDDGRNIDFTGVKGKNINDGIKVIKDILVEKEYLKNNKDVLVGFAFVNNSNEGVYEDSIKDAVLSNFDTENITYIKAEDKKDIEQAKEQGISLGRYEASKVVNEETKKKITNAPVKEIADQIKDKENVIYHNAEDESAEDVSAPQDSKEENKTNAVQTDRVYDNTTNNSINDKKNNDSKENTEQNKTTSNPKDNIKPSADDKVNDTVGNHDGNDEKSEIKNGILDLQPEQPKADENNNNKPQESENGKGNAILGGDKDTIENTTTSGKVESDKVQELNPDTNIQNQPADKADSKNE
ncbi:MAG: anti-sigma factor domain-containing protein [Clostridium sp.]